MATPYQNVDFLINKLRDTFITNNSDDRNIFKPFNSTNMALMTYEDDCPGLKLKQNSPPITFNFQLSSRLNDQESIPEYQERKELVPLSSTLKETLRSEEALQTAASESTIHLDNGASVRQTDSSRRSSSNNLIKSNFTRLFKSKTNEDIDESNEDDDDDDDEDDDDYNYNNSDQSEETNITNPEYEDANGETYGGIMPPQDELTKIDHDNLSDEDNEIIEREILDDEFDNDEDSHFLTDSDLTDSDAFLADDSLYGSDFSLLPDTASSSNLYGVHRRDSNETKKSSHSHNNHNQHHHQRTRTLGRSFRDKKKNTDDFSESMRSERLVRRSSSPTISRRASKSFSNLLAAGLSPTKNENQLIQKQKDISKPNLRSNLTQLLHESSSLDETSILDRFKFVGETEGARVLSIKVYLPPLVFHTDESTRIFRIPRATLVKDFIGYVLYKLNENLTDTKKESENPNYWCLRFVEDDGEIDDDFGPLDRGKPIAGFGITEVLLQQVSQLDFEANEKLVPLAPRRLSTKESNIRELGHQKMKSMIPEETEELHNSLKNGQITLPSKPANYLTDKNLEDSEYEKSLLLKEKKETAPVLKRKPLSSYKQKSFLSSSSKPASKMSASLNQDPFSLANNSTHGLTTSSFLKWTVWRHHQLSFKNRHERSLSIDGEYIYIIPESTADHENVAYKYLVDTNNTKTTSFHVSQIMKCKQSRKYPMNLKIVVMKATGPKRYDLEALDAIQSEEIVKLIKNLVHAYNLVK